MLRISLLYSSRQISDSQPLPIMILLAFLYVDVSVQSGGGKLSIGKELFCSLFNESLQISERSGLTLPTVYISFGFTVN